MVAYGFMLQFCQPIADGLDGGDGKGGTIRGDRVRGHAQAGDHLQLYYAMRTKQCRLIGRAVCIETRPVKLDFSAHAVVLERSTPSFPRGQRVIVFERVRQLDAFARFDGFGDFGEMRDFWKAEHDARIFDGWHIRWLPWPPALLEMAA
jgi:hypothetical protein